MSTIQSNEKGISFGYLIRLEKQIIKEVLRGRGVGAATVTLKTDLWSDFMQAIAAKGLPLCSFDRSYAQSLEFLVNENGNEGKVIARYTPKVIEN